MSVQSICIQVPFSLKILFPLKKSFLHSCLVYSCVCITVFINYPILSFLCMFPLYLQTHTHTHLQDFEHVFSIDFSGCEVLNEAKRLMKARSSSLHTHSCAHEPVNCTQPRLETYYFALLLVFFSH